MKHFIKWFILVISFFIFSLAIGHHQAFADGVNTCQSTYPTDAPNLYQVFKSSGSATLYFVEPLSQFDGYTISYGTTSSADSYNVTFSGTRTGAATSYMINDLTSGTNYYFKVRANNGCATGPWSPTLSSLAKLPETGPSNILLGVGVGSILMLIAGFGLFLIL